MARRGEDESGPDETSEGGDRRQDPLVDRLKPDPSQPVVGVLTLTGFIGESDRPGFQRLYFTTGLDYYAEFKSEDVVHIERVPKDEPPFVGEEATRLSIRRDATLDFTRTRRARPIDEFDLDVRFRPRRTYRRRRGFNERKPEYTTPNFASCPTCYTHCLYETCETCPTCGEDTCGGEYTCEPYLCPPVLTDECASQIETACEPIC